MLQNLHTHSTFCDGKNTPEQIVERAIELGFDSIGFSSHAPTCFCESCELRDVDEYVRAINALKEKYSGKTDIFLGIEMDYYSAGLVDTSRFDYSIASVHEMKRENGEILYFDYSADRSREDINTLFGGDGVAFAKLYYQRLAELPTLFKADIVGHFDLITKYSERHPELIDTDSAAYRSAALEALHALRESFDLFEVNTGAIGRGYKKHPYPAPFILKELKALGAKLVITSDCHKMEFLDTGLKEARSLLSSLGFSEIYNLTAEGFKGEKI